MHFRQPFKRAPCTGHAKLNPWLPPPDVIDDWLKKDKERRVPKKWIPLRLPADLPMEMPHTERPPEKRQPERGTVVLDF